MKHVLDSIRQAKAEQKKLFAVLIDPEKCKESQWNAYIEAINQAEPDFVFIGGSQLRSSVHLDVSRLKSQVEVPVVLFPGNAMQLTSEADALLLLSLISGRNPEMLIEQHVRSAQRIHALQIEVIPTGYILVDGGKESAVEIISQTSPLKDIQEIVDTALAGEMLGLQLIYLEAGSGARYPVSSEVIAHVKAQVQLPLIVGGGLRSEEDLAQALDAGADLLVVGNYLEDKLECLTHLTHFTHQYVCNKKNKI